MRGSSPAALSSSATSTRSSDIRDSSERFSRALARVRSYERRNAFVGEAREARVRVNEGSEEDRKFL